MSRLAVMALTVTLGTPSAALAQDAVSAFGPGEQATYRVHVLGVKAGSAQLTVGAQTRQWGQDVWPIVMLAKTESLAAVYPIKDKFVTYWDHDRQLSIGSDLFADEGRKRRRQRIKLDLANGRAQVFKQKEGQEEVEETREVDPSAMDIAAVTYAIRNKPFEVGGEHRLPVFTGTRTFILKATVEGVEQLDTPLGKREVYKVRVATEFSGKLQAKRDLFAYFTTDQQRIPVRLEAEFILGNVVAELVDYQPGRTLAMTTASGT